MKPSFWSKRRKNYKELYESSINGSLSFSEIVEPVPSEFQGKEAIRYDLRPARPADEQITWVPDAFTCNLKTSLSSPGFK